MAVISNGEISACSFAAAASENPRYWLKQHFGSIIDNGVATHIAFLSIGLPKQLLMLSGPLLRNPARLGLLVLAALAGGCLNRRHMKTEREAPIR